MSILASNYRIFDLPWSLGFEDEGRFRKILLRVSIAVIVLSLLIPALPVPERDPAEVEEVPPRFAKLLLERRPPPPPPPVVQEIPEPEPEPEPEPVEVVEKQPEPEPLPEPEPEVDPTEKAREKAAMAGLLPFANQLADLRESEAVASITKSQDNSAPAGETVRAERSLITSKVGSGSGGINTAALSRNTGGGGGQLSDRETTQVLSSIDEVSAAGAATTRSGNSQKASRSREEIEMVFDKNKGAIYSIYQRALRRDPTLQGKLVLRLTIAPSGMVTDCEVVSSEIDDPEFERKLVARVKMFQFVSKDVESITTTKPIDFFPA